jgi:hypothetical protein
MATLALQANINDANLQANKIYKRTGQTPTQPTDMRLTSEKLADIARLRIEVRAQLSGIMDGQDATSVSNELSPESLRFVAQNINGIVKDVKEKYKLGMPAQVFETYLNSYMVKSGQVNEVAYGLQQERNPILGAEQIREIVNEQMLDRIRELLRMGVVNPFLSRGLDHNIMLLENDILPLIEYLTPIGEIPDLEVRHMFQEYLNIIFNRIATVASIQSDLIKLERAVLGKDPHMADIYAEILRQKLAVESSDVQEAKQMTLMIEDIKRDKIPKIEELGGGEGEPSPKLIKQQKPRRELQSPVERIIEFEQTLDRYPQKYKKQTHHQESLSTINPDEYTAKTLKSMIKDMIKLTGFPTLTPYKYYENIMLETPMNTKTLKHQELVAIFNSIREDLVRQKEGGVSSFQLPPSAPPPPQGDDETSSMATTMEYGKKPIRFAGEPISVKQGKGLRRITRPLGRPPVNIVVDYSEGVMPVSRFIPFGKLFIDKDRLGKGIISLRKGEGAYLNAIRTRRVSPNLNDIITSISGGGTPSFSQLSKLDEDERRYLYELGKQASLLDRIGIPAPSKDEDDKDINQFEIMKGEIASGNDSVELVKKFKALIVKMIAKGLLPKGQGKNILLGLVELGY